MARTRAGLSGRTAKPSGRDLSRSWRPKGGRLRPCRPACRSVRLDHACAGRVIEHTRPVPRLGYCFLAIGQPVIPFALGLGFGCSAALVRRSCCYWSWQWHYGCAACRASISSHGRRPCTYWGGGADRRLGEPRRGALHPAFCLFS